MTSITSRQILYTHAYSSEHGHEHEPQADYITTRLGEDRQVYESSYRRPTVLIFCTILNVLIKWIQSEFCLLLIPILPQFYDVVQYHGGVIGHWWQATLEGESSNIIKNWHTIDKNKPHMCKQNKCVTILTAIFTRQTKT